MDTVDVFDLNTIDTTGYLKCPYCQKGKTFSYNATGKLSCNCFNCKRMVLWDFDRMMAYKAKVKRQAS